MKTGNVTYNKDLTDITIDSMYKFTAAEKRTMKRALDTGKDVELRFVVREKRIDFEGLSKAYTRKIY
jgi:hypothetical protein